MTSGCEPRRSRQVDPKAAEAKLFRGIGRWDLVGLLINILIGAGILGLPAKAYGLVGLYSFVALGLAMVLTVAIALCFCELSSRFDATGGPYLYAKEAFGENVAFAVGWLLFLSRAFTVATLLNVFLSYSDGLGVPTGGGAGEVAIVLGLIALFGGIALVGVRQSAVTSNVFSVVKVGTLGAAGVVGLVFVNPFGFGPGPAAAPADVVQAVLLFLFAFMGFESAAIASGEMKEPQRNLPFGMLTSIALVAVLYALVLYLCIGLVADLASSQRPVADAVEAALGENARVAFSFFALITLIGGVAAGFLLVPRLLLAFAEAGQAPAFVAAIHNTWRTPHVAIILSAGLIIAMTLSADMLTTLSLAASSRLILYAVCCLGVLKLRRAPLAPAALFRAPGGAALPIAAAVAALVVLLVGARDELLTLGVVTAAGFVLLALVKRAQRTAVCPAPARGRE